MGNESDAAFLRQQAAKCLRLANAINDHHAAAQLRNMAMIYEIKAKRLEANESNVSDAHQSKVEDDSS